MTAEPGPGGFDTIVNRPDYYIEFLDARTALDGEIRVKQVITRLLDARDGMDVLDVGTGTGEDALLLAAQVAPRGTVLGIDHSPEMIAEARRRALDLGLPVSFVEGDARALEFAEASFDRTRAERVLMHLADPAAAIREMARVTRPDGRVVVSDIDGGTMFVNSSNQSLTRELVHGLTDDLQSGWVGRNLPHYLVDAGLEGEREGWLCSGVTCFTVVGRKPA